MRSSREADRAPTVFSICAAEHLPHTKSHTSGLVLLITSSMSPRHTVQSKDWIRVTQCHRCPTGAESPNQRKTLQSGICGERKKKKTVVPQNPQLLGLCDWSDMHLAELTVAVHTQHTPLLKAWLNLPAPSPAPQQCLTAFFFSFCTCLYLLTTNFRAVVLTPNEQILVSVDDQCRTQWM